MELYHPGIDQVITVDGESVGHYRASGWLTTAEHEENQRTEAARTVRELGEETGRAADQLDGSPGEEDQAPAAETAQDEPAEEK